MASEEFLLLDANVLIDYQAADLTLLSLVSRHLGTVHVVTIVLAEVDGLDAAECERLGCHLVEPTLEQLAEAAASVSNLSFEDQTCLIVCRENGWTCVSNDKALRASCEMVGVSVCWGLELLLKLVGGNHLPAEDADDAAVRIQQSNSYLPPRVLKDFRQKLEGLRKRR